MANFVRGASGLPAPSPKPKTASASSIRLTLSTCLGTATQPSLRTRGAPKETAMLRTRAPIAFAMLASNALPSQAEVSGRAGFEAEVGALRSEMQASVPRLSARSTADDSWWTARAREAFAASGQALDRPMLMVVVDRNPAVQQLRVLAADPTGEWEVVGGSQVSTGKPGRREHFRTPMGVFVNSDAILGYRAAGTYNENHIRGLGVRGMRVWDFGWRATDDWRRRGGRIDIRLSMHATDPVVLEPRIGRPDSEGCVRLSAPMNRFLDHYGVIDADYERAARTDARFERLLARDREPSPLAGNALVVFDSSTGG